ncbi:zinc finger protein 518B [Lepisosteus oculatus]|uniref:zinc finger protein 518B n=1 Tax=Lepisosteus oculatus TaxID=7918 RepID=UPI0035F51127
MNSTCEQNVLFSNMENPEEKISKKNFQEVLGTKHTKLDKYHCDKCRYTSKDHTQFKKHVLQHEEIKFACSYCSHISYTKGESQRHLVEHTGTFPYKCSFCDYGAVRNDYIVKHTQRVHGTVKRKGPPNDSKIIRDALPIKWSVVESKRFAQQNITTKNALPSTVNTCETPVNVTASNKGFLTDGVLNKMVNSAPTEQSSTPKRSVPSNVQVELIAPLNDPIDPDIPLMVAAPPDLIIPPNCFVELVEVHRVNGSKELELKFISQHVSESDVNHKKEDQANRVGSYSEADGSQQIVTSMFPCNFLPKCENTKTLTTSKKPKARFPQKAVANTFKDKKSSESAELSVLPNVQNIPNQGMSEDPDSFLSTDQRNFENSVDIPCAAESVLGGSKEHLDFRPFGRNNTEKNAETESNDEILENKEGPVISSVFSLCCGTEDFPDCVRWGQNLNGVCGNRCKNYLKISEKHDEVKKYIPDVLDKLSQKKIRNNDNKADHDVNNSEFTKSITHKDIFLNDLASLPDSQLEITEKPQTMTCNAQITNGKNTNEGTPTYDCAVYFASNCECLESTTCGKKQNLPDNSQPVQEIKSTIKDPHSREMSKKCIAFEDKEAVETPTLTISSNSPKMMISNNKNSQRQEVLHHQTESVEDIHSSSIEMEENIENCLYSPSVPKHKSNVEGIYEDLDNAMPSHEGTALKAIRVDETIPVQPEINSKQHDDDPQANQSVVSQLSTSSKTGASLREINTNPAHNQDGSKNQMQTTRWRKGREIEDSPPVFIPQGAVLRILNPNQSLQSKVTLNTSQDYEDCLETLIPRPVPFTSLEEKKTCPETSLPQRKLSNLTIKRKRSEAENEILEENLKVHSQLNSSQLPQWKSRKPKNKKCRMASKVKICKYSTVEPKANASLCLTPLRNDQLIKLPSINQPVVVLNHPAVDTLEVTSVMRTVNRYKGNVFKVVLCERAKFSLYLHKRIKKQSEQLEHTGPVTERRMLKMKFKKIHQDNYQVVGFVPEVYPARIFKCWFCARMFYNQEEWLSHGQRHLTEATRDWNAIQNPTKK